VSGVGVAAALLLVAGGGALVAVGARSGERASLARLRRVVDAPAPGSAAAEVSALALVWTRLARAAERAGRGSALFDRLAVRLAAAGWPLRPAEYCIVVVGVALVAAVAGAVVFSGARGAVCVGLVAVLAAQLALTRQARRSAERADAQLPDVLAGLAASLRTGYALGQALEAVAEQAPAPLGPAFARVLAETRVGRPLEEALAAMAERVGSTDLRWSVRAMAIQARTGGRLADILEVLAEFLREREEVRREVAALTADGRFSALVLLLLPFAITAALLTLRPGYLAPLVGSPLGLAMVAAAAVLMTGAFVAVRRIVRVEV
jgi:tight adherence protein B